MKAKTEQDIYDFARYAQQVGQMDEAREALLLAISQGQGRKCCPIYRYGRLCGHT
jgi:hypothetical protein